MKKVYVLFENYHYQNSLIMWVFLDLEFAINIAEKEAEPLGFKRVGQRHIWTRPHANSDLTIETHDLVGS